MSCAASRSSAASSNHEENICNEIITSERAYLDQLDLLTKLFIEPLSETNVGPVSWPKSGILARSEARTLWGEIRSIRLVNQVLLDRCQAGDVLHAFATLTPFLKLYSSYARNFPHAQSLLQDLLRKRRKFTEFVERVQESPQCRGWRLQALLITPIQRIPRYKLLLESLLHHKEQSDFCDDIPQLREILSTLTTVTSYIDSCVADQDNTMRVLDVQRELDACAPALLQPGRRLVKQGLMAKVARHGPYRVQRRKFWLFNDLLVYGKPNPNPAKLGQHPYLCSCVLPLRHVYAERIFGTNQIRILCKSERLLLQLNTFQEVDEWINALHDTIRSLHEARITLRKESSKSTPTHRRSLLQKFRDGGGTLERKWRERCSRPQSEPPADIDTASSLFTSHPNSPNTENTLTPTVYTGASRHRLNAAYTPRKVARCPDSFGTGTKWRRPKSTMAYVYQLLRRSRARSAPPAVSMDPSPKIGVSQSEEIRAPLRTPSYYASVRAAGDLKSTYGASDDFVNRQSSFSSRSYLSTNAMPVSRADSRNSSVSSCSTKRKSSSTSRKRPLNDLDSGATGAVDAQLALGAHKGHTQLHQLPTLPECDDSLDDDYAQDLAPWPDSGASSSNSARSRSTENYRASTLGNFDRNHETQHKGVEFGRNDGAFLSRPLTQRQPIHRWWELEAKQVEPPAKKRKLFELSSCSLM